MSYDDEPNLNSLMERVVIQDFVLQQKEWLIMALVARIGCEAKITIEELDFVRKTYEMDESVSSSSQVLSNVYMRLKLKV